VLYEIRTVLANDGKFGRLLKEHGIPRRTAYDLIDNWKRLSELKPSQVVRKIAGRMNLHLTANRFWPSLKAHKRELQEADTEEKAVEILDQVKRECKRPSSTVSESERRQKDYEELVSTGGHWLAGMKPEEKIGELERLLRELLPGSQIIIKLPGQQIEVMAIGA